jgi:hypothetical protein
MGQWFIGKIALDIEGVHLNLVRSAHNWNNGIVERWNIGFWEIGMLVHWKNFQLTYEGTFQIIRIIL